MALTASQISHSSGQLLALLRIQRYFTSRPISKRRETRPRRSHTQHRSISSTSLYHDKAANTSSSADTVESVNSAELKTKLIANIIKPKSLFPWRHSPYPLPRLVPPSVNDATYYESEFYQKGGHLGPGWPRPLPSWFCTACQVNSMRLLGLPYWKMLLPWVKKEWIHDMEDAFCDAFGRGVTGIILDTYSLEGGFICSMCPRLIYCY